MRANGSTRTVSSSTTPVPATVRHGHRLYLILTSVMTLHYQRINGCPKRRYIHLARSALTSSTSCHTDHSISLLNRPRQRKATTRLVASIYLAFSRTILAAIVLVRGDSKLLERTHVNDKRTVGNDAKLAIRTYGTPQ